MRGVFQSVRRDHEDRMRRNIFLTDVFMNVADVLDRSAERVDQGGAAGWDIVLLCHFPDLLQRDAVIEDVAALIEEHRGYEAVPFLLALLFDHGIESADRILLQAVHRPAAVQDKYQFCKFFVHLVSSFCLSAP